MRFWSEVLADFHAPSFMLGWVAMFVFAVVGHIATMVHNINRKRGD